MTITLLDGGMGQELLARTKSKPTELWATQVMMDHPDVVRAVHDDYFAAGAVIATTNTYAIHRDRLAGTANEDRFEELHILACRMAVEARDVHGSGLVAGSLGPLGWSYRPDMAPPAEDAATFYAEIVALHAPHVDLHICETMSSVDQARGALMGCASSDKPVWVSFSVDDADGRKLRSGEPVTAIFPVIGEFKPAAVLINCSTPEAVSDALPLLADAGIPFGAYANGFTHITGDYKTAAATVDKLQARTDLGPEAYAVFAETWVERGATIIGGCCEVGPAHIRLLSQRLKR